MPTCLYVPEGIDVAAFLPKNLRRFTPEATYMLSKVECTRVFNKSPRTKMHSLKALYLQNIMGMRNQKPIREALVAAQLLECDRKYVKGVSSMKYRLGEKLKNVRFVPQPCPKRIAKRLDKHTPQTNLKLPVHRHLREWSTKLELDHASASKAVRCHEDHTPLDLFDRRELWFIPDTYGRVHTNLTSFPGYLRRFLSVGGLPIEFVDVVNSQPLLMGKVAVQYHLNDKSFGSLFDSFSSPSSPGKEGREGDAHYDKQFVYLLQNQLGLIDLPKDVREFSKLTQDGEFYEVLMDLWSVERDEAKNKFFSQVMYCEKFINIYRARFGHRFPNVLDAIDAMKAKYYKHAGQLLQRIESKIIIHKACVKMMEVVPEAPLFTIHDSIGTTNQYVDSLKAVMLQSFKVVGFGPKFK